MNSADRSRTFGDAATPVNPAPDYFVMTIHPPRMDRGGYVEFTLTVPAVARSCHSLPRSGGRSDAVAAGRGPRCGASFALGLTQATLSRA